MMTAAPTGAAKKADEAEREKPPTQVRHECAPASANPLPGVMDFVGAHVGGELAEERWR